MDGFKVVPEQVSENRLPGEVPSDADHELEPISTSSDFPSRWVPRSSILPFRHRNGRIHRIRVRFERSYGDTEGSTKKTWVRPSRRSQFCFIFLLYYGQTFATLPLALAGQGDNESAKAACSPRSAIRGDWFCGSKSSGVMLVVRRPAWILKFF